MDLAALDWGSVPDYLAVFGIIGGIIVGIRTWSKDRREQRELEAREREEKATSFGRGLLHPAVTEWDFAKGAFLFC